METKKVLRIKRTKFLGWYLDKCTIETIKEDVCSDLYDDGKYSISVQEIWKGVGYIPADLIENINIVDASDIIDEEIQCPSSTYGAVFI